ncbi:MAG: hypothetical protein ACE5I3_14815 [Phycisphaerae bacterium]
MMIATVGNPPGAMPKPKAWACGMGIEKHGRAALGHGTQPPVAMIATVESPRVASGVIESHARVGCSNALLDGPISG